MSAPERIVRPAVPASLRDLLVFVEEGCRGLPEETAFAVRLAAEEACTNVISHAYAGTAGGPVALSLARRGGAVEVTVEDEGVPFDPASLAAPDLGVPAEERALGGLGWHLIRQVMDEVRHERPPGGGNRLTLRKSIPSDLPLQESRT